MKLTTPEINLIFNDWLDAWNKHDLEGVMCLFHDDIVFDNWTGVKIVGKESLQKVWTPWFQNHGNFIFKEEDVFFDENEQKMLFMWKLEWPSLLKTYLGKPEIRRGVDVLYFRNGKIFQKHSYSKTTIRIDGSIISL
jgi:hypothetical protein